MKKYLRIQSNGIIEKEALTLIGASTKRDSKTAIGYYGSGLCYSASSLLRNNIELKIFAGTKEIELSTRPVNFRGNDFEVILVDGEETSLTTTMGGASWDEPFAPIREIYSNALDEDSEATLKITENVCGTFGKTSFFIELTDGVNHFVENIALYFCNQNKEVLYANNWGAIYANNEETTTRLFRKNILCHKNSNESSLFNYNSSHFKINESRVLENLFDAKYYLGTLWKTCQNESMIRLLIDGLSGGNYGQLEHDIDYGNWRDSWSIAWYNVASKFKFVPAEIVNFCEEHELKGRIVLPAKLLKPLYQKWNDLDVLGYSETGTGIDFIIKENPSPLLTNKVVDAISILSKTRYNHRLNDIDIAYVNFASDTILGYAENNKIYLSTKLDTWSVHEVAKIIIEENEHNITKFSDETREFQNHLFSLYFEELLTQK